MSTATQPIRSKKEIRALINYYLRRGQIRNHALIVTGIYTALRVSDLLRLTWADVYDFKNKRFRKTITITEKKTGKAKIIALNKNCTAALKRLIHTANPTCRNQSIFENKRTGKSISRVQAYRIIRDASKAVNMENHASCHSLRKTFGYFAWQNGVSPVVIMEIYNHSSLAVTMRYLGVTQDDKNAAYLNLNFADSLRLPR